MKLKKKIVSVLTAAALAVCLTGCGAEDDSSSDKSASTSKKYTIGICQLLEHEALDSATKGFKDALTEKLGKDNVEFDEQNAQGEATNCSTICNNFVTNNVDLIMANATGALQAASQATADIPILGTSVTDYGTALNIKDWSGKTGTNVSGTSDLAPIDQQEDMILELIPDVKKVGILYCSSEPNSAYQSDLMKQALEEDNIEYKEYTAADSNEIQTITTTACNECDVLYVPTDNTMASSAETIKNIAVPAGIPMIAGEAGICQAGIATLSISYYDLGYQTGEMAYDILKNGKKAGDVDVAFASKYTKMYNEENCKALNIEIPEGYSKLETKSE
ncbi:MAG: ABC transporter substrate-binding protein [Lachnospiraceae bacterium]|jgi:putative ABC transport system substrate-binding protein|nr:ABC transporter substrate-binding protein [Lachnospiraceae bacterium]